MDSLDKALLLEFSKFLLAGFFSFTKQQGLTDSEITAAYFESKIQFEKNDPAKLEGV